MKYLFKHPLREKKSRLGRKPWPWFDLLDWSTIIQSKRFMMCQLIAENSVARLVKFSDRYEVVEDYSSKRFSCLTQAKAWFNLISKGDKCG